MFNPYNSYSWTSCLFSTLNTNNSWWIIFSYSYAVMLQKKVVRQTEILIYKFLSNRIRDDIQSVDELLINSSKNRIICIYLNIFN